LKTVSQSHVGTKCQGFCFDTATETLHSVKRVRKENPFWDMALDNDNHLNLLQDDAFDVVLIHMAVPECL
jgi:hypothetical protein